MTCCSGGSCAAKPDIFAIRQLGREVAREVGLDKQDQTRLATALSEVARVMLATGGAEVRFMLTPDGVPVLQVTVENAVTGHAVRLAPQLTQVGRLVDTMEVGDGDDGTVVRMARRLPPGAPRLTPERMDEIRTGLAEHVPGTPLDELAVQNQQLITALVEVRAQRDDLARLNAELEETNRGVMALYHQLSDELEETNRGVVALYAELDEKSVQLRAASEAKSRFLANVSHELRAPVTAIIGLGRLLTDSSSDRLTEDQGRQIELIRGFRLRPAVAGQRPARPGQGGGRAARASVVRGGSQGDVRSAARHVATAGHPARGGLRGRRARRAGDPLRRGTAGPGAA